jgi:hypothetical protein
MAVCYPGAPPPALPAPATDAPYLIGQQNLCPTCGSGASAIGNDMLDAVFEFIGATGMTLLWDLNGLKARNGSGTWCYQARRRCAWRRVERHPVELVCVPFVPEVPLPPCPPTPHTPQAQGLSSGRTAHASCPVMGLEPMTVCVCVCARRPVAARL